MMSGLSEVEFAETLRCFIALDLSESTLAKLERVRGHLQDFKQRENVPLSIPKLENSHITLQFLGDTPSRLIEEIDTNVRMKLQDVSPFSMQVRGVGAFPNLLSPRVIWAGLRVTEPLGRLHRRVTTALHGLPVKRDRKAFAPHLTLARLRDPRRLKRGSLAEWLKPLLTEEFGETIVDEVILYRSELLPEGARYTVLKRWKLSADTL